MTLAIVRELHQHYSEILYNPTRFKSTQDIMEYIIQTAEQHNRSVEPTMVPLASTVDITSVALPVALPVVLQVASQVASTEASLHRYVPPPIDGEAVKVALTPLQTVWEFTATVGI